MCHEFVHHLRAFDDDRHEMLAAEFLDDFDVGETYKPIVHLHTLVGKRIANAPREGAWTASFEPDALVHDN